MGALEQSSLKTTSFQGHFNPLWMYSGKKYRPIIAYGQGLLMQSSFKHLTERAQIRSITKAASSSMLRADINSRYEPPSPGACYPP